MVGRDITVFTTHSVRSASASKVNNIGLYPHPTLPTHIV